MGSTIRDIVHDTLAVHDTTNIPPVGPTIDITNEDTVGCSDFELTADITWGDGGEWGVFALARQETYCIEGLNCYLRGVWSGTGFNFGDSESANTVFGLQPDSNVTFAVYVIDDNGMIGTDEKTIHFVP